MPIEFDNQTDREDLDFAELAAAVHHALNVMDVDAAVELSITATGEEAIAQLHEEWLDLPGATDVMSFPMDEITPGYRIAATDSDDVPRVLGDIVLCPDFAARQADLAGHPLKHELIILTVHGVLHLLGFDHYEPEERRVMFDLQVQIVSEFIELSNDEKQKLADTILEDEMGSERGGA